MSDLLQIESSRQSLEGWIEKNDFSGWDPYDALNSPLFSLLAQERPWIGIALTQVLRLLPVNMRLLLGIPKVRMTKTVALIVQSYLNLAQLTETPQKYLEQARIGLDWLVDQQIQGFHGACWGYSHDWQSHAMFVPKSLPSLVCTAFVARALLQGYSQLGDSSYLDAARSSCDFLLLDIPRYHRGDTFCFSYIPGKLVLMHNANLLGVELLGHVFSYTGETVLQETALQALNFTLLDQKTDGSWYYDAHTEHGINRKWIDNFHTGFLIESLSRFSGYTGFNVEKYLHSGLRYYAEHFFASDGRPKRSSLSAHTVDLRDCAQAIIVATLIGKGNPYYPKLYVNLDWTLDNMHLRSGLFTYQRWRHLAIPIPYLRFQSWMFYALTCVEVHEKSLPK